MSATGCADLDEQVFELPGGGRALFTERAHGNLSSVGGDRAEQGLGARERLRESLGVRRLLRGYQVHGSVVGRVFADGSATGPAGAHGSQDRPRRPIVEAYGRTDSARQPAFEADGHAVAAPALAALVLTADC